MTDLGHGIYLSNVETNDFEPDEEVGGLSHYLFEEHGVLCGLWKPAPGPGETIDYVLPTRETVVVLEGTVRIEVRDGPTLHLTSGDMLSLPKGAATTWHPSQDFKEIWFFS